jgi:hypothetical protein
MAAQLKVVMGFFANFASFAVKALRIKPFNRKGRKGSRKERKEKLSGNSCRRAQDGNDLGASETTISFPEAICSRTSIWRLRKCERARSPQARTK